MPTYYVLATRRVELRGHVKAVNRSQAIEFVKKNWEIYDHPTENAVCAGVASLKRETPIISEYDDAIKILYLEDEKLICKKCGQKKHDGPCFFDKLTSLRDRKGYVKRAYRETD